MPLPHNFPLPHISMFLYFRDYCKTKLQHYLSVSNEVCFILQDILGSFLRGKQGLVDMSGVAELHNKFQLLKSKWEVYRHQDFINGLWKPSFQLVESSMLKYVRKASGLGSPLDTFYTNDVESANHIIKRKTNYRVCEWPEFCQLANYKELVEEQLRK